MTEGRSPWDDPTVAAGFQAAYEPQVPRHGGSVAVEDAPDPRPAVPRATDVLPLRTTGRSGGPVRLSPTRALAGAAMSVAGVALGITTLLWVTDRPSPEPGPVVTAPVSDDAPGDPLAGSSEREAATLDPPAVVAPPTPPAPAPVPAPVVEPVPTAPSVVVPVTVLNNSRIPGLAERGAARFAAEGWPVAETGNYRGRIRATTVYYPAGLEAPAQAFAARFPGVARVLPRPDDLPGSGLTVVLTRDFAS